MRGRTRLNVTLLALVLACTVLVCLGFAVLMPNAHQDKGGDTTGGWWERSVSVVLDRQSDGTTRQVGDDVGPGLVQAVRPASEAEQARWAEIVDAASGMATAFLNVDHRSLDETKSAVLARATGAFREQYETSFDGLMKLTRRAESVQTGEVVWAGISSADQDSATVFVVTSGDVVNNTVETAQARHYRVQLELVLEGGEWLTRDLRFIDAQAPAATTEEPQR